MPPGVCPHQGKQMLIYSRFKPGPRILLMAAASAVTFNVLHAQPEGDAWNNGSAFAAGSQCEARGFMAQGQTTPVMAFALQRVPRTYAEQIRDGYQEGLKRSAVYSRNAGRWIPLTINQEPSPILVAESSRPKLGTV